MLMISRTVNTEFTIQTPGGDITVRVLGITQYNGGRSVVLGIEAPRSYSIERDNIKDRKQAG